MISRSAWAWSSIAKSGGHLAFGTDRSRTITATDRLLSRYKSEGFEFVTIPEMMGEALSNQPSAVSAQPNRLLRTPFIFLTADG